MAQSVQNVDAILKTLEQKSQNRSISIWIPSLKKHVKFRRLTLAQQKALIKSSIQENMLKLDFSSNIYSIIKANITNKDINVDTFNIIDKICIGVAYRAKDINNEYGFYTAEGFFEVDLNDILTNIEKVDVQDTFIAKTLENEKIALTVQIPTLKCDKELNTLLLKKYSDIPDSDTEIKDMLTDLYIYEAAKYIVKIVIKEKAEVVHDEETGEETTVNKDTIIDFKSMSSYKKIQIIEKLPTDLINKITIISDKAQSLEALLLDVNAGDQIATIEVNSTFFS